MLMHLIHAHPYIPLYACKLVRMGYECTCRKEKVHSYTWIKLKIYVVDKP